MAALDAEMAAPENAASYRKLESLAGERDALAREYRRMIDEWEALGLEMERGGAITRD